MSKLPTTVSAKYFRLYYERHIIGFKRILISGKQKGTIEYLSMTDNNWVQEELFHDVEIPLSTPPMGVTTLERIKLS